MFFGTGTLKNFAMFTVKYLCWSFFLIKLQAFRLAILLKTDSSKSRFLWNLQNLCKHFFYRILPVAASGNISWALSFLHMRMMNGVFAWYVFALQRLIHFVACVSFLSISFPFLIFLGFYYLLGCGEEVELFLDF